MGKQLFVFLFCLMGPWLLVAQQAGETVKKDSGAGVVLPQPAKKDSSLTKKKDAVTRQIVQKKPDSLSLKISTPSRPDSLAKKTITQKIDSLGKLRNAASKPDSIALLRQAGWRRADSLAKDSARLHSDSARKSELARIDSSARRADSIARFTKDTLTRGNYVRKMQLALQASTFLNAQGKPAAMSNKIRKAYDEDDFFYLLAFIGLLLGFFRFFYARYFNNLFRVFFNASLRQSQLTDQLLQAKLPSLFFNIVFILSGGMYIYLLLVRYGWVSRSNFWLFALYCILSLAVIYLAKFISVKFTGWLTGYKEATNTYIFIIFLINKILGVLLLPFAVLMAFSIPALTTAAVIVSLLLIGMMFLLRFFRSYGLLGSKLKISKFHFLMYVVGIEILPVLLIYKGLVLLLGKNL